MKRILLCTDLDRTLIPNGEQPETPGVRDVFAKFVERDDVSLAYVSGRHRGLIQKAIEDFNLPVPDFAIADVGTTIYRIDGGRWKHWVAWDEEISGDWNGHLADRLAVFLRDIKALRLQEVEKQNTHKLSYYVDLQRDQDSLIATVKRRLREQRIAAKVIWSIDEEHDIGLLDILPASASKLHAIEFMMNSGHYDADHTVFSGDSGNDLDVLLSPIRSVLVANGDDAVRKALIKADPQNCYIARGGFCGLNGNYGAGILEGVAHFCPDFAPVIEQLCQDTP